MKNSIKKTKKHRGSGKIFILAFALSIFSFNSYSQSTLYVSSSYTGSLQNGNIGTPFKTLDAALDQYNQSTATNGTIFIKAGNYQLGISNSQGYTLTTKPVKIIGYYSTPNDNCLGQGLTSLPTNFSNYLTSESTIKNHFPKFIIDRESPSAKITLFKIKYQNIELKNLFISGYDFGVNIQSATNSSITNVFVSNCGKYNSPTNSNGTNGGGIIISSDNCVINSCRVINSTYYGIGLIGVNSCSVINSMVWCNLGSSITSSYDDGTDYYFLLSPGSDATKTYSNNWITGCSAVRTSNVHHHGHGYLFNARYTPSGFRGWLKYNKIINCKSDGTWEGVSFRGERNTENSVENHESIGGGILFIYGAFSNRVTNSKFLNSTFGVYFSTTSIYGWTSPNITYAAATNTIANCLFTANTANSLFGTINYYGKDDKYLNLPTKSNQFINCTFVGANAAQGFIRRDFDKSSSSNIDVFTNCLVTNYTKYKAYSGSLVSNEKFTNCFINVSLVLEMATLGVTNVDAVSCILSSNTPEFVNSSAGEYDIQSTSPCRNAGTLTGLNLLETLSGTDLEGKQRVEGSTIDIGCFEYQSTNNRLSSVPVNPKESDELLVNVKLFPNPTSNNLNIIADKEITEVTIFALDGKLIMNQIINASSAQIQTDELTNGIYFANINFNSKAKKIKFIKN